MNQHELTDAELRASRPQTSWAETQAGRDTLARVLTTPTGPTGSPTGSRPQPRERRRPFGWAALALVVAGVVVAAVWATGPRPLYAEPEPAATPSAGGTDPSSKYRPYQGPTSNPFDDPDSPHRVYYDSGLISDPLPTPAPAVSFTAAQAVALAAKHHLGPGQGQRPVVTLRLVTVDLSEATPEPPAWPGWVLTWRVNNQHLAISGPMPATPEERKQRLEDANQRYDCVYAFAVNANTGRGTQGFLQTCRPTAKR